jgi:hypothetical protein
MKLVVVESPFAGAVKLNLEYARACIRDSLMRGEAPFASHILYTGVLHDDDSMERELGMTAGFMWSLHATLTAVYQDRGISNGMRLGIAAAEKANRPIEYRSLKGWGSNVRNIGEKT